MSFWTSFIFTEEDGTLTTWSNMVRQQRGGVVMAGESGDRETRGRTRTKDKEENNINNNMDSSRKSRWARIENPPFFLSKSNSCREKETWWCLYNFWLTGNGFNVALLFIFSSRNVKSSLKCLDGARQTLVPNFQQLVDRNFIQSNQHLAKYQTASLMILCDFSNSITIFSGVCPTSLRTSPRSSTLGGRRTRTRRSSRGRSWPRSRTWSSSTSPSGATETAGTEQVEICTSREMEASRNPSR